MFNRSAIKSISILLVTSTFIVAALVDLKASLNDDEMLPVVLEGTKNAVDSIKSAKGTITVCRCTVLARGTPDKVHETRSVYRVALAGNKYRVSEETTVLISDEVPGLNPDKQGTVSRVEKAIDGTKIVVLTGKRAEIGDTSVLFSLSQVEYLNTLEWIDRSGCNIPGNGLVSLKDLQTSKSSAIADISFRITGRERIDGNECIVVERRARSVNRERGDMIDVFWVDPNKGFTIPRVRRFHEDGVSQQRTLYHEINVDIAQYKTGVWYPVKIVSDRYSTDETGIRYKSSSATVEYASGFEVNVPVSEAELSLELPSGTQVDDSILKASYVVP